MIDESWYRRPPGVAEHTAAGGVVIRRAQGRLYVALIREGGLTAYVLPKGHVEPGETLDHAARREVAEESGLRNLTLIAEVAVRQRLDYSRRSWGTTHYFLFVTTQAKGAHPEPVESPLQTHWFPLDALPALFWPEQRELLATNRERIIALLDATRRSPSER